MVVSFFAGWSYLLLVHTLLISKKQNEKRWPVNANPWFLLDRFYSNSGLERFCNTAFIHEKQLLLCQLYLSGEENWWSLLLNPIYHVRCWSSTPHIATAGCGHFELSKYSPKRKLYEKNSYFNRDSNLGPQKLLIFNLMPYH